MKNIICPVNSTLKINFIVEVPFKEMNTVQKMEQVRFFGIASAKDADTIAMRQQCLGYM
jgi:hypothetical protein